MTDLDDALNRSNPIFHPVQITAEWQELWPNYNPALIDDLRDLGQQVGPGGYTVSHSLDDGLPDPVTMTSGSDASGQFSTELIGRTGTIADVAGFRTTPMPGGSGTGTTITITASNANQVFINDRAVVGIVIPAATTYTTNIDPEDPHRWRLVSSVVDGTVQLLVFTLPVYYAGTPSLILTLSVSSAWVWTGNAIATATFGPAGAWVYTDIGENVHTATESVSQVDHTLPNTYLEKRGWVLSFWATDTSNAWSTAMTELTESAGAPRLMMARTALRAQQWETTSIIATTAVATATAAMIAVPIEIRDRPTMDALQYFSPFNKESPVYGFDRDTAPVTVGQPVISPVGPVNTTLFKGTMVDIGVSGRTASMEAISQTRLDVDRVIEIPLVRKDREGSAVDWLVGYILSRGRRFIGHAATAYTRWWVPLYGSIHAFVDGSDKKGYNDYYRYTTANPGVVVPMRPVPFGVPGPYAMGMYAQYQQTDVQEIFCGASQSPMKGGATVLGFDALPDNVNDFMSQANNKGRISFWLRGDAATTSPAAIVGAPAYTNTLFRYRLYASKDATTYGEFNFIVREDRQILLRFGSTADGYFDQLLTGAPLPTDGEWHHYCCAWDWDAATCLVRMDNTTWTAAAWATTTLANLPVTEAALWAAGGTVFQQMRARIPASEFMSEAGAAPYAAGPSEFWPGLTGNSGNTVFRSTLQPLDSLSLDTPVQGWETLAQLAQATLSHYRTNEDDDFEFLPPTYFGENAQMTPVIVADTDINAGELAVSHDPSKSRNVVTLEFKETTSDFYSSYGIEATTAIELPRGIIDITFTSDEKMAEIYGASNIAFYFEMLKLTSAQIATPSTIPTNRHTMTINTKQDGSGTVYTGSGLKGSIVDWGSTFATVRFTNSYSASLWLSNDGNTDVPFLRIRTYLIREATGYTTQRDPGSIGTRRERALSTSTEWIHDRTTASNIASQMVNVIARPRAQVTVEVMGDPRRRPGDLVSVADSQGTQAEGTWRVLSVQHNGNGAQFTQTLQLVQVLPIAVWDGEDGWDNSVWGE